MPQNATRQQFTAQIRKLHFYLGLIAARPLEFNTTCRALAQEALDEIQLVTPDGACLVWRDPMDEKQRDKILRRPVELVGGKAILGPREGKDMNQAANTPQNARTEAEPAKTTKSVVKFREGDPCDHPGCLSHITKPCEGCGRIGGFEIPAGAYVPKAPEPTIHMIEVESSNLARVGFHNGDVLRVQFKNKKDEPGIFTGDMWDYKGISKGEYIDLVNSDSPGQTYNALTKNRGIKGTKVGGNY